jgi:signal transduction histidine kinase
VEDSGIGIALEHQVRIFEKFYQVDHSLSKPFKGLGLGLRIAKELVELHCGKIWVGSQPSMGSSFHFVLPRKGPAAPGT